MNQNDSWSHWIFEKVIKGDGWGTFPEEIVCSTSFLATVLVTSLMVVL